MAELTKLKPDHEIHAMLAEVLENYHPDLAEAGVTIGLKLAYPGESGNPEKSAVLLHGYECAAVVRINSYRWRVEGIEDATIEIDGKGWEEMGEAGRVALLDHECTHLTLVRDKKGNLKADACGRPKLKMRLHDHQIGAFSEIIRRHGNDSIDLKSVAAVCLEFRQQIFAWSDDSAPQDDIPLRIGHAS